MTLREGQLDALERVEHDVLVVGAGINGAVSAAALAARGARVALVDQRDFGGFTSQASSNLAWGGIKYLEHGELALVRELCSSRNRLMRSFPDTVREIRFLSAVERGARLPAWLLWLGAWGYWLLGAGATRPPRLVGRSQVERREPIIDTRRLAGGMEYSDAFLYDNDARFVWGFVDRARRAGAAVTNYVGMVSAERVGERVGGRWVAELEDGESGRRFSVAARVLVNATGPFADDLNAGLGLTTTHRHVLSKGIHLVVDRVPSRDRVLALFADDGRLFFVIPMGGRSCIGTTDTRVESPQAEVTEADRDYVLDNVNRSLRLDPPLGRKDIIAERCGVRPLAVAGEVGADVDFLQLSRRHALEVQREQAQLSIFGGKLTDCLNVGEEVCAAVRELGVELPAPDASWFGAPLPADRADFMARAASLGVDELAREMQMRCPEWGPDLAREALSARLWRRYGSEAHRLLDRLRADPELAAPLVPGAGYRRCELHLAAEQEMVVRLEDLLRRRSRVGLMVRREVLAEAPGVEEACRVLFGADAERRRREYFGGAEDARRPVTMAPLARAVAAADQRSMSTPTGQ